MRARAETPGHRFSDEDRAIIRDIVDKLEGMPLAIELAAARTGLLSLSQLRERLVDSLRVLQTTSPGRTSKSLSMRASIDASWALLKPWEKLALAQVCVFHGGFTLDAGEGVLAVDHWPDAPWTMDIIHSLIRHSLLRAVSTSDGERRLSLYESIRQYAVEKMNTEGSVQAPSGASLTGEDPNEALQLRHAEYYAQRGLLVSAQLRHEKTMRAATIELQLERDNLIAGLNAAVSRGQGDLAAGCARTLATLCHSQGPLPQGILWLDQALELPSMTVVDRAMLVDLHTQLRYTRVGALTCTGPIEAVLDLPDEPALNGVKASLHSMLWLSTASTKHEPTTAQSHIDEALRLARLSRDWTVQGDVLRRAAVYYIRSGDLDQAAVLLREAMDKFRDRSDIGGQLQVLNNLGAYYMQTGDLLRATSCRQEALVLAKASGNLAWEARLLHNLGEHDFQRLDLDAATRNYRAALEVSRAAGDMMTGMLSSAALGEVSLTRGDYADAEEWFRRALQTEPNTDIPHRPHSELALTYARQGKFDLAGQALEKLQTLPPITNVFEEAKTLARCAEIQFLMGDIKAAKGTLHAASAVCEAHGFGPGSEAHALLEFSRKLLKEE
jgi:predicted ATPase